MERVEIETAAYCGIILHGARYPSSPILGLLVGNEENNQIHVHHILPVYHSPPVGALFDIALLSIPSIYSPSMKLLGFYFSNDRNDSDTPPHYIQKINETIRKENNNNCLTLQLKNSLLENMDLLCLAASTSRNHHPQLFLSSSSSSSSATSSATSSANESSIKYINTMINSFLVGNIHRSFQDMEDHTESTHQSGGSDFRNNFLESVIQDYMKKNSS